MPVYEKDWNKYSLIKRIEDIHDTIEQEYQHGGYGFKPKRYKFNIKVYDYDIP